MKKLDHIVITTSTQKRVERAIDRRVRDMIDQIHGDLAAIFGFETGIVMDNVIEIINRAQTRLEALFEGMKENN